jgi:hypothetical protein
MNKNLAVPQLSPKPRMAVLVKTSSNLLDLNLSGGTEESYRKLKSGQSVSWLRFELGTAQIQVRSVVLQKLVSHSDHNLILLLQGLKNHLAGLVVNNGVQGI